MIIIFDSIYEIGTKIYTEDFCIFMRGTKSDPCFFRIIFLKYSKIPFLIVVCVMHRIEKTEQFPTFRRCAAL